MATSPDWRYVAEYLSDDGEFLATAALEPDFGPALECCRLAGVRSGSLAASALPAAGRVEPVWADEVGAPRVRSLRAGMVADDGDGLVTVDLDASLYLRDAIRRGASRLVADGRFTDGQLYRHRVLAFAVRAGEPRSDRGVPNPDEGDSLGLEIVEDDSAWVPIAARPMPGPPAAGTEEEDCPVFLHAEVERDLLELATDAGDMECGAGLLGFLARDPDSGRLFTEVTALAPVRGGVSESRSFVFTDEAWASIHEIAALRGRGELLCGYAHSHPNFCARCPPERHRNCLMARPFFSNDDVHLHRACFPAAWKVALLASDLPSAGRTINLFGWSGGVVRERSYALVPDAAGHGRALGARNALTASVETTTAGDDVAASHGATP